MTKGEFITKFFNVSMWISCVITILLFIRAWLIISTDYSGNNDYSSLLYAIYFGSCTLTFLMFSGFGILIQAGEKYLNENKTNKEVIENNELEDTTELFNGNNTEFSIGDHVVRLGDEVQMEVTNIDDNNIYCQPIGTLQSVIYKSDEIELFDKYWANKNK